MCGHTVFSRRRPILGLHTELSSMHVLTIQLQYIISSSMQPVCHHDIQYGWMFLGKSCQLLMNGVMNGWVHADVINQSLVDDPTALPPGFNIPRHLWANWLVPAFKSEPLKYC